jgi:hypothetical protein
LLHPTEARIDAFASKRKLRKDVFGNVIATKDFKKEEENLDFQSLLQLIAGSRNRIVMNTYIFQYFILQSFAKTVMLCIVLSWPRGIDFYVFGAEAVGQDADNTL